MSLPTSFSGLCMHYRQLRADEQRLEQALVCCRKRLGTPEPPCTLPARLAELERRQLLICTQQQAAAVAIGTAAATLEDERLRAVIELRYLDALPWTRVSELLGLDLRWVMRLHARSIATLDSAQQRTTPMA